jgi:aminoglycoside phosphotransferase (APT) family kinase protein
MLKAEWEKTGDFISVGDDIVRAMAAQGAPGLQLEGFDVISGGCGNLNLRLSSASRQRPLILRIYVRERLAALREQALSRLVVPDVPAPEFLYVGVCGDHTFALVECMEGTTLREVLLDKGEDALCAVHDAGRYRALLQRHRFPHPGSLNENAEVKTQEPPPDFIAFADEHLARPFTQSALGAATASNLARLMRENRALLPDYSQSFLVHGDYDPANILVRRDGAGWTVSGILDWEFASAGPWLWDVSNMLRYSHLLPPTYEGAFLEGLKDGGAALPPGWRVTMRLMNISSLLWILRRCENGDRPKMVADICRLLEYIAGWLGSAQAKAV